MTFEPVLVKCIDISVKPGWLSQDDVDSFVMDGEENIVYQSGFLYEEDETQVCLLNSYFHNQDLLGDVTKIPKGAIIEMIKLK
jgi:hypothetical protein